MLEFIAIWISGAIDRLRDDDANAATCPAG